MWIDIDKEQPADGEEVIVKYEGGSCARAVACWWGDKFDGWMVDALAYDDFLPPDERIVAWMRK